MHSQARVQRPRGGASFVERPEPNPAREHAFEARKALYEGFGNALGMAVELVVTPMIFLALGVWLDGRAGTSPVFAVMFGIAALVGVSVAAYYRYLARMAAEEEGQPWRQ
jgi:hypothetical protein